MEIKLENILVIDDYKSVFKDDAIAVELIDGKLQSTAKKVEIENNIWDGQSLLDSSMFGSYKMYGMLLLRSRFFKSCCFNTNLQQWFEDNNITNISQLNGYTVAKNIEDIKLITTRSSIKYVKFGSLEDWIKNLEPTFGVVKHDKPTYFFSGRMVQCHYQLLNTIQLSYEELSELIAPSFDYLSKLKTHPSVLRKHIDYQERDLTKPESLKTANDIIYVLMGLNEKFVHTKLYKNFCKDLFKSFIKNLRKGHLLVYGNYSTLFGNPLEMLNHSIHKFDGKSKIGKGKVHSLFFEDGEMILGSRSPHVANGNVLLVENVLNADISKYFNLTKEIVCLNAIEENILERLSGADYDSDSILLTNNKILIDGAKKNYNKFLVPTKKVESIPVKRKYSYDGQADLDIKTSVNLIGEIINLSQELNSKLWDLLYDGYDFEDCDKAVGIYKDISQLDIMSNLEIDSAKKENPADNMKELKDIKKKYEERDEQGRYIRPKFFEYLDKQKGYYDKNRKAYKFKNTTMDFIQKEISKFRLPRVKNTSDIRFIDLVTPAGEMNGRIEHRKIQKIIDTAYNTKNRISDIWHNSSDYLSEEEKYRLVTEARERCMEIIGNIDMNENTMFYLLSLLEKEEYNKISRLLFTVLFNYPNKSFYSFIYKSKRVIPKIEEDTDGEIQLYNFKYKTLY